MDGLLLLEWQIPMNTPKERKQRNTRNPTHNAVAIHSFLSLANSWMADKEIPQQLHASTPYITSLLSVARGSSVREFAPNYSFYYGSFILLD